MNVLNFVLLMIANFITGRGILAIYKIKLSPVMMWAVAMITGLSVSSFWPFLLELCHIPLTPASIGITIGVSAALCCIPLLLNIKKIDFSGLAWPKIYELPFLLIIAGFFIISFWRSFYTPPTPRDMTTGPEAMAELALREKSMINSLFSIDLQTTNNYLKPAYITSLQIIYKMFVSPFGQVWLIGLFVPFTLFLYELLKEKLHPVLAGLISVFFLAIPEVYAYTFMILFDYSNMVFFFLGFYFIARYIQNNLANDFLFAALLFGMAAYTRVETVVFLGLGLPLLVFYWYKQKTSIPKIALRIGQLFLPSIIVYLLVMTIFNKHYIPIHFDVSTQLNQHLSDFSVFFNRLNEMTSTLLFSEYSTILYGYFKSFFLLILFIDLIFFRKSFNKTSVVALIGIAIVYIGLPFIGYLIPWVDLMNTTKRGLFKLFPLLLLYLQNSGFLVWITNIINSWEYSVPVAGKEKNLQPVQTTNNKTINKNTKKG